MNDRDVIQLAWKCRSEQDQEGFLKHLMNLKRRLPPGDEVSPIVADWAQIQLLQVSFLRQKNAFVEAADILARVQKVCWEAGLAEPARLFMERGLNALAQSDYFAAFEDFSRCVHATSEATLHMQARINALITAEALGLPHAAATREFEAGLKTIPEEKFILDQWQAFRLRAAFREGNFELIPQLRPRATTQGEYFQIWFAHLPFQNVWSARARVERMGRWMSGERALYLASYRVRTLQAISHPDDAKVAKLSQKIGRLYLWTWLWLDDPVALPIAKLDALLVEIQRDLSPHKVGVDEAQMIRNAITWICLFHPGHAHEFHRFVGVLGFATERANFYDLEYLVANYLTTVRDRNQVVADDLARLIAAHPILDMPGQTLRQLFRPSADAPAFALNVHRLLESYRTDLSADLVVDLNRQRLVAARRRLHVSSEPGCRLLWLLRAQSAVDPRDLMTFVFEIPDYDASVHQRKINNLLARVRPLLPPGLKLLFRGGRVIAHGEWGRVAWVGEHAFANRGASRFRFRFEPRASARPEPEAGDLAGFGGRPFSRRDLEKKLKKSRATINRTLREWLRMGLIRTDGRARSTRYVAVHQGDLR